MFDACGGVLICIGFYQSIDMNSGIEPIGIHVFDGDTADKTYEERSIIVQKNIGQMEEIWKSANLGIWTSGNRKFGTQKNQKEIK